MKEKLENIKNMYCDLKNKLAIINEKIMDEERIHDELTVAFNTNGVELDSISAKFKSSEENILENKKKFILKKINRHNNIVSLISFVVSFGTCALLASNGLVMSTLFAFGTSFGLAGVSRMVDVSLFWDKLKNKYDEEFEELDYVKELREKSDELYVEKLKIEDKYSNSQRNIIEHTTKLNSLKREKHILETELDNIKLNAFDDVIQNDISDEMKLTLK